MGMLCRALSCKSGDPFPCCLLENPSIRACQAAHIPSPLQDSLGHHHDSGLAMSQSTLYPGRYKYRDPADTRQLLRCEAQQ